MCFPDTEHFSLVRMCSEIISFFLDKQNTLLRGMEKWTFFIYVETRIFNNLKIYRTLNIEKCCWNVKSRKNCWKFLHDAILYVIYTSRCSYNPRLVKGKSNFMFSFANHTFNNYKKLPNNVILEWKYNHGNWKKKKTVLIKSNNEKLKFYWAN